MSEGASGHAAGDKRPHDSDAVDVNKRRKVAIGCEAIDAVVWIECFESSPSDIATEEIRCRSRNA